MKEKNSSQECVIILSTLKTDQYYGQYNYHGQFGHEAIEGNTKPH
jgi:hypothetical protein